MTTDSLLEAAAFGDQPGLWPLPSASTSRQLWLRAVAAGGQGHYGAAMADLAAVRRAERGGPLASLAHSTHGSFVRQLGGHDEARFWDGRALALAGPDSEPVVDALLGLAADALGMGRLAASAGLLARARAASAQAHGRLPIRVQWVAAELAMAQADGKNAVEHAQRSAELAAGFPSLRHQVKSQVVHAAALCCAGRIDRARAVGDDALAAAGTAGLVPLRWAIASLLAAIGSASLNSSAIAAIRDDCAEAVRHAGGAWRR